MVRSIIQNSFNQEVAGGGFDPYNQISVRKFAYRASVLIEVLIEGECSSARQEAFRENYILLVRENKRISGTVFKMQLTALVFMIIFTVIYAVKLFV